MKFGDNLTKLSVPEWKSYNLDYNDIKSKIKQLTKRKTSSDNEEEDEHSDSTTNFDRLRRKSRYGDKSITLKSLQQTFVENFNYVDLFIVTKRGELERKLFHNQKIFNRIAQSNSTSNILDNQIQMNEINYQVLEISRILRNLNRFIIIQKIACNKIFKKFSKYYANEEISGKFIHNLKTYLSSNPNSFINIDLTNLTLELSYFLDFVTEELKRLDALSAANTTAVEDGRRRSKNSLFSNKSTSSTSPNSISYTHNPHPHAHSQLTNAYGGNHTHHSHLPQHKLHTQQIPNTKNVKFDLDIIIKKNFKIDCLIADNHNLNDLLLNLRVLLNCENLNDDSLRSRDSSASLKSYFSQQTAGTATTPAFNYSLVSFTYLTGPLSNQDSVLDMDVPAYIISQFNQDHSLIVSYVGGLRRFAYCLLPNDVVELLLKHLLDPNDQEIMASLHGWFSTNSASPLTKMAIDWILNKHLKPTLKLITKRSRYLIRKAEEEVQSQENAPSNNGAEQDDEEDDADDTDDNILPCRALEDDFLLCLDQDIVTTNNGLNVQTIEFDPRLQDFERDPNCLENLANDESYDKFPFHHFSIFSNDSNLSNFKSEMNKNYLTNKVNTEPIITSPNQRSLKRVPLKVQQLLNLNSINLFNGDLNFFHYMNSCYYNKLPPHDYMNSHFMNLLTLNLLKQNENISTTNELTKLHTKMFDKKTRQVLRTQSSLRSIKSVSENTVSSGRHAVSEIPQQTPHLQLLNHQFTHHPQLQPQNYARSTHHSGAASGLPIEDEELQLLHNSYRDHYTYNSIDPRRHPLNTYGHTEDSSISFFDKFVSFASQFRQRFLNNQNNYDLEAGMTIDDFYLDDEDDDENDNDNEGGSGEQSSLSSHYRETNIREKYEDQYMRDYDEILSIIYFSFFFISLFISGIIMGIVYSLIELSTEETQFLVEDNVLLILIIIIGLLLSLMFSMVSINLNTARYKKGPAWHTILVWTGSGMVCLSFVWCLVLLFQ